MRLRFITGNKNKVREAGERLAELGYEVVQDNMKPPEVQADSLEEVALFSAKWVVERSQEPFFLEDAGFFVDYLKGFPGVYSAYVFDTIGYGGILRLMRCKTERSARFEAVIAYWDGREFHTFKGVVKGTVSRNPRGENGFGYDPIFIPEGEERTFAEMSASEKNAISHRGRAIEKMVRWLKKKET